MESDNQLQQVVPEELHGSRLDVAAAKLFPNYSRSRLAEWIKSGRMLLDGQCAKPRDKVMTDSLVLLTPEQEKRVDWLAEPLPIDIIYEDEHLIVLNKPAGLVTHPAAGHASGTLVNGLLSYAPEVSELPRGGIVHRLDKDTSGVMFAARSSLGHRSLVAQLSDRSVTRVYSAVCRGYLTGGGTIDAPIGRHPASRTKMAVVEEGKPAITHYRIEQRFAHHTHLKVHLESGRTHQIRVHLAWRKHPLIGDPVYAGRAVRPVGASHRLLSILSDFRRQALHSQQLIFDHPVTGRRLDFSAPLPSDMSTLLSVLEVDDALP